MFSNIKTREEVTPTENALAYCATELISTAKALIYRPLGPNFKHFTDVIHAVISVFAKIT